MKKRDFFARNRIWVAVATMVGIIVGAGILGIPYVIAKSGFFLGAIIIITIGLVFLILNLYLGEIVLRTKEQHQLSGYMEKYLGRTGKALMAFSMMFGIYGALIAYIIGEGEALRTIFAGFFSLPPLFYSLAFFLLAFFIVYRGVKTAGKAELIVLIAMVIIIILISLISLPSIDISYLTTFHPSNIFFPLGVIIFAFISSAAVPEMQEVLHKEKKKLRKAIIIGSIIPIFIYLLFSFAVVGLVGLENFNLLEPNQRIATVALSFYTNQIFGVFVNLIAFFAMFTSFLGLGIGLVEMYQYDFHFSRNKALALTLIFPLVVTLTNLTSFIAVIGITGSIAGGINGILIVLAYWRSKKLGDRKPEYVFKSSKFLGYLILVVFSFGILYQIYSLLL